MFVKERREKIKSLVLKNQTVKVNDLSEFFGVTKDVIRKDLSSLEKEGVLERTYGGAIKKIQRAKEYSIQSRINKDIDIKIELAEKGLKEINEGDAIFLDISSVNYLLAKKIIENNLKITVITNMVDILTLFSNANVNQTSLISIGGEYNKKLNGFVGLATVDQIKSFSIDKCFIGTIGVNIYAGKISTYDIDDGLTKNIIIENSNCRYLITEKKKFSQMGKFIFNNLENIDVIITENSISNIEKEKIKEYKTKII